MAQTVPFIKICPECGADSPSTEERCWICRRDLSTAPEIVAAEEFSASRPGWVAGSHLPANLAVLGCMLVTLVGIGVGLQNHWSLIPYVIIASPALLLTLIYTEARVLDNQRVRPEQIVMTFLVSTFGVVAIVALLALGLFIAFWLICYALGGPDTTFPAPR